MISKVSECNFGFDAHFDRMKLLKLFLKVFVLSSKLIINVLKQALHLYKSV